MGNNGKNPNLLFILFLIIVLFVYCSGKDINNSVNVDQVTIGAIRWDAWFADAENPYVKNLAPLRWNGRLPFYAKTISNDSIEICGDNQEVVDQEIVYAKAGGIDYWAFLYYSATPREAGNITPDKMNRARRFYLSSTQKSDINFCLIINPKHSDTEINEFLDMMLEPSYQKVMGDRPLLYIMYWYPTHTPSAWFGSNENCRAYMNKFRARIMARGLKSPYCVVLTQKPEYWSIVATVSGFDAISAYTSWGGSNYSELKFAHIDYWNKMKATGLKVVPNMTAGWGGPRDSNGDTMQPTPDELSSHLRSGFDWIDANPNIAEAKTMLFYAWNENDEGGWLVPDKGQGHAKLDAIRTVVNERRLRR